MHDLVRQRTSSMSSPFVLDGEAGFVDFAAKYAAGAPIFVGLQGFDVDGVPVPQRAVGVGTLLPDGSLSMTSWTTPSTPVVFNCDHVVIVDVMSVDAVKALAVPADGSISNAKIASGADGTVKGRGYGEPAGVADIPIFSLLAQMFVRGDIAVAQAIANQNVAPTAFGVSPAIEAGNLQVNVGTANYAAAQRRRGYQTAATAGAAAGVRWTAIAQRGNGGFYFAISFVIADASLVAGARMFAGLRAQTTIATDVAIDSIIDCIGIGHDAGDAGFSVYANDATGTASKLALDPAKFPVSTSIDVIRAEFWTTSAGFKVTVKNLTTGETQTITLTSDLPSPTALLVPTLFRGNGAAAVAARVDFLQWVLDFRGGLS